MTTVALGRLLQADRLRARNRQSHAVAAPPEDDAKDGSRLGWRAHPCLGDASGVGSRGRDLDHGMVTELGELGDTLARLSRPLTRDPALVQTARDRDRG
jgi:hypothetical protein